MCLWMIITHTCSQPGLTVCGGTGVSQPLAGDGVTAPGIALGTPLGMVAGDGVPGVLAGTAAGIALGIHHGTLVGMVVGMQDGIAHTTDIIMAGAATIIVRQTTPSVVSLAHVAITQA